MISENASLSGGRDLHIFPSDGSVNTWLNDPKRENKEVSSTEEVQEEEVDQHSVKDEEILETAPEEETFEDCKRRGIVRTLHICVRIPSGEEDAEE